MKTILAILCLLFISAALPSAFGEDEAAPAAFDANVKFKKIILLYTEPDHPWASHMYEHEARLLAKCLEQTPGVAAEVYNTWPADESVLDDAAAIVYYSRPAGDIVLDKAQRAKFLSLMEKGTGFAAIHWATQYSPAEKSQDYLKVLGGTFNFAFANPPLAVTKERLKQEDAKHPICRGWTEYDLRDEWYLAMRFDPRAKPLLKVQVQADESQNRPEPIDLTVAWTLERDKSSGRSFGTTLGHFHDNFGIEAFRKMLVNGILWTAHVDIPITGAPVLLSEHDLVLPEPPKPNAP